MDRERLRLIIQNMDSLFTLLKKELQDSESKIDIKPSKNNYHSSIICDDDYDEVFDG